MIMFNSHFSYIYEYAVFYKLGYYQLFFIQKEVTAILFSVSVINKSRNISFFFTLFVAKLIIFILTFIINISQLSV